jgi:hypothetical protein
METKFLTLTRKDLMPYCKTMDFESVDIYSFNKSSKNLKEKVLWVHSYLLQL